MLFVSDGLGKFLLLAIIYPLRKTRVDHIHMGETLTNFDALN